MLHCVVWHFDFTLLKCRVQLPFQIFQTRDSSVLISVFLHKVFHLIFANGSFFFTFAIFLSSRILIVCKQILVIWVESICTLVENQHCSMWQGSALPFELWCSINISILAKKNYARLKRGTLDNSVRWDVYCQRYLIHAKYQIIASHYMAVCDLKLRFVMLFLSFPHSIFVMC